MLLYDSAAVRDVHHETLLVEIAPPGLNTIKFQNLSSILPSTYYCLEK